MKAMELLKSQDHPVIDAQDWKYIQDLELTSDGADTAARFDVTAAKNAIHYDAENTDTTLEIKENTDELHLFFETNRSLGLTIATGVKAVVVIHPLAQTFTVNLVVSDEAALELVVLDTQTSAAKTAYFRGSLGKSSKTVLTSVHADTLFSRLDVEFDIVGELAKCELSGVTVLDGNERVHIKSKLNHLVPEGFSRQTYKNILNGNALSEYHGGVYIKQHAQLTDSAQRNENLLLSTSARALSRPQLEVHADDVKAGHGSTVGQLDDKQVFYLRSRGLDEIQAKRMLLDGFVNDVIERITVKSVQAYLNNWLKGQLS